MTSEQKFSKLFVKAAYSPRANISDGIVESQIEVYRKKIKELTNDT